MKSMIGYNKERIEGLRNIINNIAQETGEEIVNTFKNGIIIPISTNWYAPDAVDLFSSFSELVKYNSTELTASFDSFRYYIQKLGERWAEETGEIPPILSEIDSVILNLDVSSIQPNNNGDVVMNQTEVTKISENLIHLEGSINDKIKNFSAKLDAESAFIGGGQSEAIRDCFNRIYEQIHKIFEYLVEGDNSLKTQINKMVSKYGDISRGIVDSFTNNYEN